MARTREIEGEPAATMTVVCVPACIDCFRCGIIAIRGCKQAGESVSVILSAQMTLRAVTAPAHYSLRAQQMCRDVAERLRLHGGLISCQAVLNVVDHIPFHSVIHFQLG